MGALESAVAARQALDGKDLFQGCCHLSVNFSSRSTLTVKQNSAKSRDFTVPQQPGANLIGQAFATPGQYNQFSGTQFGATAYGAYGAQAYG